MTAVGWIIRVANRGHPTDNTLRELYFVENAKIVVLSNLSPGRRIVEGKLGWLMESG